MAVNLRAKIGKTDSLTIFDVNQKSTQKFMDELTDKAHTTVAGDVREVAEKSVSAHHVGFLTRCFQ